MRVIIFALMFVLATEVPRPRPSLASDGEPTIAECVEDGVPKNITRREKKASAKAIAAIRGHWEIRYSNKVIRRYVIQANGDVIWDDVLIGRIVRSDGTLLLQQERDAKLERLTLGVDGRLFIEHWRHASHFPDGSFLFGIGTREE